MTTPSQQETANGTVAMKGVAAIFRPFLMLVMQVLDVVAALQWGRLDRLSYWLWCVPALLVGAVYFGTLAPLEASMFCNFYFASILIRAWLSERYDNFGRWKNRGDTK